MILCRARRFFKNKHLEIQLRVKLIIVSIYTIFIAKNQDAHSHLISSHVQNRLRKL